MEISGVSGNYNVQPVNQAQTPNNGEEAAEIGNGTTEVRESPLKAAEQERGLGNKVDLFA